MKNGVYINTFNDTANLITIVNGSMMDGEVVSLDDYSVKMVVDLKKDTIILTFAELEYLGEL